MTVRVRLQPHEHADAQPSPRADEVWVWVLDVVAQSPKVLGGERKLDPEIDRLAPVELSWRAVRSKPKARRKRPETPFPPSTAAMKARPSTEKNSDALDKRLPRIVRVREGKVRLRPLGLNPHKRSSTSATNFGALARNALSSSSTVQGGLWKAAACFRKTLTTT